RGDFMVEQQQQPRPPIHETPADTAKEFWSDAKDTARTAAASQQRAAAQNLGDFAGALRQAARSSQGEDATVSRVADNVAGALERLSSRLHSRDFDSLLRDVEGFARQQPMLFIGAAVLAGFVATRFLKSSDPSYTGSAAPRI